MRLRRRLAAIAVLAAVALETAALPAYAASAGRTAGKRPPEVTSTQTVPLLSESFRDDSLADGLILLGDAGLTNAEKPNELAPANTNTWTPAPNRYTADGEPDGFLQLTDNSLNQAGALLYDNALPSSGGLDVSFEMYQYNSKMEMGHPADGIGFFIIDGNQSLNHRDQPGAYGGSLGYAQKYSPDAPTGKKWTPGIPGGYLGVGFDVLGNNYQDVANGTECRGSRDGETCEAGTRTSPASTNWGGNAPNTITLRGPAKGTSGLGGYEWLATTVHAGTTTSTLPGQMGGPNSTQSQIDVIETSRRLVRVTIGDREDAGSATCPAPISSDAQAEQEKRGPWVRIYLDFGAGLDAGASQAIKENAGALDPTDCVLEYQLPDPMPNTFKFGFAGSTGAMTDVHLIRTLEVATLRPVTPEIRLEKEAVTVPVDGTCTASQEGLAGAEPSTVAYAENDEVCYRFKVTNVGDIELTNVRISDPLLAGVTDPESLAVLSARDGDDRGGTDTAYFYATYKVTAEDVERKSIVNTATATGVAGSLFVTDEDSETVPTRPFPGILLEKTVAITDDGTCDASLAFADSVVAPGAGTPVCYRFHVTNTGNAPLAISLEDSVIGFTVPAETTRPALQPGSSTDFYRPYTVSGTDTAFVNTATVVGTHEGGTVDSTDNAKVIFAVDIPLPQVGGERDVIGVVALIVSAALTVYLLNIRRRQHGMPAQ